MWSKPYPATKLMKVSENSEKGQFERKKRNLRFVSPCSALVAGAGRGEAEEPERSDGNRLYGSCADKKAVGSKSITAFYDNKKAEIFYDIGSYIHLVAGAGIEPTAFRL